MVKKDEKTTLAKNNVEVAQEVNLEALKKELYEKALEQVKEEMNAKKSDSDLPLPIAKNIKRKEMLDKQMLVPIMNVTNGKLIYQSRKTGSEIQFENYGDIEYIELYELLTMRSSYRKFLDEPFIIVLDDEVSDYLGLSNLYKKLTHATEIDRIFSLPIDTFKDVLLSAPKGLAHLIVSKAKEKISNGQLDSVQKVEVLEEVYNVALIS